MSRYLAWDPFSLRQFATYLELTKAGDLVLNIPYLFDFVLASGGPVLSFFSFLVSRNKTQASFQVSPAFFLARNATPLPVISLAVVQSGTHSTGLPEPEAGALGFTPMIFHCSWMCWEAHLNH
jgi:hypothetical protein